jgi:transcriptional regulator with XRE-family HTH domain
MEDCISFGKPDIQKAMPKKPSFIHPLRQVRDAISEHEKGQGGTAMSQSRFARMLRVSRITIAKIENGKLGVSVELQRRILGLTGAEIPTGKTTTEEEVWGEIDGLSYCAESWRTWSQHLDQVGKMSPDDLANGLIQSIRILMLSAKVGKREQETRASIYNALKVLAHDLKLEGAMVKVIDRLPKVKRPTQSGGTHSSRIRWPISDYFAPLVAPILDTEISKQWPVTDEQREARSQRQGRTRKKQ